MKKSVLLCVLSLVSAFSISRACTTFFINNHGQMVFGRNYDWVTGNGMVCVNQRGLSKTSLKTNDGQTISWVSIYGSISFNQYGKEFPTGGMNEKGLVVELMWLDGTQYPSQDSRPAVGVLQWIQYQLDNSASVNELVASDKIIRIASKGTTPLHYLVADADGNAATIEFFDGKMTVHRDKELPFPVLTNNSYAESLRLTDVESNGSGVYPADNSLDRFAKACTMLSNLKTMISNTSLVDYSFSILDKVAQGSFTKWSIVYDITNKKIFFKTNDYTNIKSINFSGLDFTCSSLSRIWDMNQAGSGIINGLLNEFSIEFNKAMVEKSAKESADRITISGEAIVANWSYPKTLFCTRN